MGCDIHMFAEVSKNGKWEQPGKIFKNQFYEPEKESEVDSDGYEWNAEFQIQPYDGRNYDLFAILANVRNGRGFAGIKTGEGFKYISEPKGLPQDVSESVKKESNEWGCDGHSHSFFTVKELLDYDWSEIAFKQGYIPLNEFEEILKTEKKPYSWCAGISGRNIKTIDEQEAEKILNENLQNEEPYIGKEIHVLYRWSILYSDHCKDFLENTIPELQKLGNPEDVRIVFWFDN